MNTRPANAAASDRPALAARHPLAVRLCNWVGEVVLAIPTLRRLEGAGYDLQLVGKGWARALLAGSGWSVSVRPPGVWQAGRQLAELRRGLTPTAHAPAAFLLTKSFSSALEARLGGWRGVGYARDARSMLLAEAFALPRFEHASHAYWHLASEFLRAPAPYPAVTELQPSEEQADRANELLAEHGLADRPFVVLCPFSGADDREGRKLWPGFVALGRHLEARGVATVVCPGPGEEGRAGATLPAALQLSGVDLGVYAALLARSSAVVANDTGPGHLAAAVGARLVAVFGPHSVSRWAPLGTRVALLQEPGGWPALEQVTALLPG